MAIASKTEASARASQLADAKNPHKAAADFASWVSSEEANRADNFGGYVYGIAQARYVIRKVFRIVDEEAKRRGIDPLEHQALLQVYGSGEHLLTINGLAERLDIVPAFASRLVKELEIKGYIQRERSNQDRRVAHVTITENGEELLRDIDSEVHVHVEYFQKQLADEPRLPALAIFAFYLGIGQESKAGAAIRSSVLNRKIS